MWIFNLMINLFMQKQNRQYDLNGIFSTKKCVKIITSKKILKNGNFFSKPP